MNSSVISQIKSSLLRYGPPFLIACMFAVIAGTSGSQYSRTRDESRHLIRGVMLLETGDYRLNKHHPLLANVFNALPVVFIDDVNTPSTTSPDWNRADKDALSATFTELNSPRSWFVPHILNPARTVTVLFVAYSIVLMYFAVLKYWGMPIAVIYSLLFALEPNIIAHSSLVTTDGWIIPIVFGASLAIYAYAKQGSLRTLVIFGILSFLALITKYSAVPIAVLWIIILFICEWQHTKQPHRFLAALVKPATVILIWFVALTAVYGFQFKSLAETNYENTEKTQSNIDNISDFTKSAVFLRKPLQNAYLHLKVPFAEYVCGFYENVILHNEYGHDTFLFGMYSKKGWWYYFPAAMAIKSPVPLLIGIAALAGVGGMQTVRWARPILDKKVSLRDRLRNAVFYPHYILILVPLFTFLLAINSSINLGYRHVLLVLPFAFLGIAVLVHTLWTRSIAIKICLITLSVWYVFSTAFIYPHYLSYFNEFIGGPANGYLYLLDSNLSWDQDLFRVDDYIRNLPEGTKYYRNPMHEKENGLVIIDVDYLMGRDPTKRDQTAWLRKKFLDGEIKPVDRIGYTYLVFDI